MLDLVIRNASIVDGSGQPSRLGSVGISEGRIVEVSDVVGRARRVFDADGLVLAPGFIDVHTHLDVQGFWDPTLSPSPLHGITTVVGGNCGFSVAPLSTNAAPYLMRMLARVEGIPLESLEQGVPWDWTSTAEFLDRLDGQLAINSGFKVGHSALRRVVMDEDSTEREATEEELEQMLGLLRDGIAAGGLGFSSTWGLAHHDAEGRPVPSRAAPAREIVALAGVCREFEGTSLEFLPSHGADADALMIDMTTTAARPLNWNLIQPTASSMEHWRSRLALGDRARAAGGKIVGLVLPDSPPSRFSFRSGFGLDALEGWADAMAAAPREKLALLSDPAERQRLDQLAQKPGPVRYLANWPVMVIVETLNPDNKKFEGLTVAEIAASQRKRPFDALLDIVCKDELLTRFARQRPDETQADREARTEVLRDPRAVVGGSDAGAHLDMLATFNFSTTLLEKSIGDDALLSLEEAVHQLTERPAQLYGLRDRGRIKTGAWADLVLFDPDTIGSDTVRTVSDLPGDASRLFAGARGIAAVFVNGTQILDGQEFTGSRPGRVLRSGRDTATPTLA